MAPITDPTLLPPFVLPPGTPLCAMGGFCTGAGLGNVLVVAGAGCDELAGDGTIPAPQAWLHAAKQISFLQSWAIGRHLPKARHTCTPDRKRI